MRKPGTSDLPSVEEGAPLILQFSLQTVLFPFHLLPQKELLYLVVLLVLGNGV
jgi:hypothetical protein